MKYRVGACALMFVLAGCTGESPSSKLAAMHGSAATGAASKSLAPLPASRAPGKSIANAPDRGALVSYANKGAAAKQEGAYTWFPVAVSEEHALKAIVTGEMTVPAPDGSQVKLRYERHKEEIDGNWTWVGRVVDGDPMQEAIITFGEKAAFGSIPQAAGKPALSLQTRQGSLWVVQTDRSKVVSATKGHVDIMIPEAATLRSSMAAAVSQSAQVAQSATAVAQAAPPSSVNTIDVAIGYTPEFASANNGASGAATRLVYLIQVGNQAYSNSGINGYLRLVHAVQVAYTNTNTNQTALSELTGSNGSSAVTVPASLAPLRTARDQYGADIAVLVRKFNTPENEGCGIAWLNGAGQTAITASDASWGYAVINDGFDQGTDGKTYYCADETLVHEAAHLMGSAHDRDNSKTNTGALQYGRYAYSFGYKTGSSAGNFYTVMAYGDTGQIAHRIFSTPLKSVCGPEGAKLVCGVVNSEDNARSLNQTIPVVAQFRATVVPFGGVRNDISGDGLSDLIFRNASAQLAGWWEMNGSSTLRTRNQVAGAGFNVSATGDFNGDGRTDLAWTNSARRLVVFISNGTGFASTNLSNDFGAGWSLIGAADINGDGKSDLIFRNASAELVGWWEMDGTTILRTRNQGAGIAYTLNAIGDFNDDGRDDLVWTNSARRMIIFTSNGAGFTSNVITNDYGLGWSLVGAADISGDGKSDLIFQNPTTNLVGWWEMNGISVTRTRNQALGAPYALGATGDFNGDGREDLIWTNASRKLVMFTSTGVAFTSITLTNDYGSAWSLVRGGP